MNPWGRERYAFLVFTCVAERRARVHMKLREMHTIFCSLEREEKNESIRLIFHRQRV